MVAVSKGGGGVHRPKKGPAFVMSGEGWPGRKQTKNKASHWKTFWALSGSINGDSTLNHCTLYKFVLGGRFKKSELFYE